MYMYIYIYIYIYILDSCGGRSPRRQQLDYVNPRYQHNIHSTHNGSYSSVVRVSASGGGGPGFNPHHNKLCVLEVSPFKVSGGSPVLLRSKLRATGSRTWKEDPLGQTTNKRKYTQHSYIV